RRADGFHPGQPLEFPGLCHFWPGAGQMPSGCALSQGLLVRLAQLPSGNHGLLALEEPWLINYFAVSAAKAASNRTLFRTPKGVRFHRPNPSEGHGFSRAETAAT